MDIEIDVADETKPDYDIADNFAENLVDAIRSDMVGNEEVYLITHFTYATGLFPVADHYSAQVITGSSSEGKSAVKGLVDRRWPNHWLLQLTDMSEKGAIDDVRFNERYVFAGDELNKLPKNAREILKSSFGDDADEEGWGYTYVRNTSQQDGDDHEEKKKQTLPFVTLIADENMSGARDWELDTRMVETKVESDEDINEAVSATMWDHDHVSVPDRKHEYEFVFEDGKAAIDNHIANIPRQSYSRENVPEGWMTNQEYANPVIIPNDDTRAWPINGGEREVCWQAHAVMKPIMPFGETDSKRSSKLLSNMVRASTLLNYHNRMTTEMGGHEYYIAEPQDLGNVIAVRKSLLALTHDLDDKKLAIIEALTDEEHGIGGPGPLGGMQAPVKDIAEYIDTHAAVSSLTENQLRPMLDEMANKFLVTKHENEGQNGAHLYEYHGGSAFGHPNIDLYPDAFENVTDPIRDQHISTTIREHKEMLSRTVMDTETLMDTEFDSGMGESSDTDTTQNDESGTLSAFSDDDDADDVTFDEIDAAVCERLQDTIDDCRVTDDNVATMDTQHMLGISPVEYYTDDRGLRYVRAKRPRESDDVVDTLLDPNTQHWGNISPQQALSRVESSIGKLRDHDIFEIHSEDNGDSYMVIHTDQIGSDT